MGRRPYRRWSLLRAKVLPRLTLPTQPDDVKRSRGKEVFSLFLLVAAAAALRPILWVGSDE